MCVWRGRRGQNDSKRTAYLRGQPIHRPRKSAGLCRHPKGPAGDSSGRASVVGSAGLRHRAGSAQTLRGNVVTFGSSSAYEVAVALGGAFSEGAARLEGAQRLVVDELEPIVGRSPPAHRLDDCCGVQGLRGVGHRGLGAVREGARAQSGPGRAFICRSVLALRTARGRKKRRRPRVQPHAGRCRHDVSRQDIGWPAIIDHRARAGSQAIDASAGWMWLVG